MLSSKAVKVKNTEQFITLMTYNNKLLKLKLIERKGRGKAVYYVLREG